MNFNLQLKWQLSVKTDTTKISINLWIIFKVPICFLLCKWLLAASKPLWAAQLKHIVKAGRGEKYISLLCFVAFFPHHYKAVMGDPSKNRLLFYPHLTGLILMCHHYATHCFVTVEYERLPPSSSVHVSIERVDATEIWHETNVSFICCFRILRRK